MTSSRVSSHILFKFLLGLFFFKVDIVKIDILEENVFLKRWTIKTFNNVMTLTWIHLFTNCVKGKDYHIYLPPVSMIFISQEIKHIYILMYPVLFYFFHGKTLYDFRFLWEGLSHTAHSKVLI